MFYKRVYKENNQIVIIFIKFYIKFYFIENFILNFIFYTILILY